MARAPYLDPARFGVRVALSAVTTVLLVLAVRGSPRPAGLEAPRRAALARSGVRPGRRARGRAHPAGQPGSVVLTPHVEIAVTYRAGTAAAPAGYAFPAGT